MIGKFISKVILTSLFFTLACNNLIAEVYDYYAANASHQPFAKGEVELIPLKVLSPKEPVVNLWSSHILRSKSVVIDEKIILPSEEYLELRFEIDNFSEYNKGKTDLIFRAFHNRIVDSDIYFQIQESDEDWFYGQSYKFTEAYAIGDLEVYEGDLNQDSFNDYVIVKYWGGNGIAGGNADVGFIISHDSSYGPKYICHKTYSYAPGPSDFVMLDNKPYFIQSDFCYGPEGNKHNYWVYNLISLDDPTYIHFSNYSHEEFPKIIWFSFKPNNNETTFLNLEEKATLAAESLYEIEKINGCLAFEWRPSVQSIINSFKSKDKEAIMNHMSFPEAIIEHNTESFIIKDRNEMVEYWDLIFDEPFVEAVGNSTFENWGQVGWRGVMYENGDIWTGKDGKIILNYVSAKGKDLVRRLDMKYRKNIHPSVSSYERNMIDAKTGEYRLRIDRLSDDVRLSIWLSKDNINKKPFKVIYNGKEHRMGSGGYYGATFYDGETEYNYIEGGKYAESFSIYENEKKLYFSETESITRAISDWK